MSEESEREQRLSLMMGMVARGHKQNTKQSILHAPFGWPGAKTRSLEHLLKYVPLGTSYCEPFGGSAALLLARQPVRFEVYNDRYGGLVDFWKCIADEELSNKLRKRLESTIYAKEYWQFCKETWHSVGDPVDRAARWFYMTKYSFSQLGRNWGRGLNPKTSSAGKLMSCLPDFPALHRRLKYVQIENDSWEQIIQDYDQPGMVFYIDPPYIDTPNATYKHMLSLEDHKRMLSMIFECRAACCLSGHSHPLIEGMPWDARYEWDIKSLMEPMADGCNNKDKDIVRGKDQEVLWIKS